MSKGFLTEGEIPEGEKHLYRKLNRKERRFHERKNKRQWKAVQARAKLEKARAAYDASRAKEKSVSKEESPTGNFVREGETPTHSEPAAESQEG